MRNIMTGAICAAFTLVAVPALADPPPWAPAHGHRAHERHAIYDSYGRYYEPRPLIRSDRIWRGGDGNYYCHRDNGTTGLIIGAALGALVGNELAGSGDKTVGMIIGAAGGGLMGQAIDRGELRCR